MRRSRSSAAPTTRARLEEAIGFNREAGQHIIERNVGTDALTPEEMEAAGRRALAAIAQLDGVVWIKSYVSHAEGKIYCEYDAPDEETVREHARRAGLRVDRISEVALEVSPAMFR